MLVKPEDIKAYFLANRSACMKIYNQRNSRGQETTKKEAAFIHRGKISRDKFLTNLPALAALTDAVKEKVKKSKTLRGLDGRTLHVRSSHSALNTLLQSAGAIIMKQAQVILADRLDSTGIKYGFTASVHDEWQIEVEAGLGRTVGRHAVISMELAGDVLKFKCPITGEYGLGFNWADTH